MLHILCWIIFGFIVGTIAKMLHPGEENLGFWQTTGLGILGSFLGGFVNYFLNLNYFRPAGLLMSILGAVICCLVLRHYKLKNESRGFFTGKKK